jgi:hypothetical protein
MGVNKIYEITVNEVYAKFTIESDKDANVTFKTNENLYEKKLLKTSNNPSVFCF